jgi:NHL repeat
MVFQGTRGRVGRGGLCCLSVFWSVLVVCSGLDGLRSRRQMCLGLVLGAVLAGLAILSSPAFALSQRGHVFCDTCTLGASGEGALSDPGDIAVNDKTGDVYVLDRGHSRIVQYGPHGEFISAWGWGVQNGEWEYQVCTSSCRSTGGVPGRGAYQVNGYARGIAVDNCTNAKGEPCSEAEEAADHSAGDVYLLEEHASGEIVSTRKLTGEEAELKEEEEAEGHHVLSEYASIDKFSSAGEPLEKSPEKTQSGEHVEYVDYDERICTKAGKQVPCEEKEELDTEELHGIAIGVGGTPWIYYYGELYPLNTETLAKGAAQSILGFITTGEEIGGEPDMPNGLAADARGDFYIAQTGPSLTEAVPDVVAKEKNLTSQNALEELLEGELEEVLYGFDNEQTSAVAVNPVDQPANELDEANDVYIANLKTEAGTKKTTIAQFSPAGQLIQRFTHPGLTEGAGIAVDASNGTVYISDAASNENDIYVFPLEEPSAPTVDSASAQDVTGESARLEAQIDPDGVATSYSFRYAPGAVPVAGEECKAPCVETPKPEEELGGAPWGDKSVSASLRKGTSAPLEPNTLYHYRVIAKNHHGEGERAGSFRTPPASTTEDEADGRIWEMVSPADTSGANVDVIDEEPDGLMQAAANGNAITYVTSAPVGEAEGNRSYEVTQLLSHRGAHEWESQDIVTPNSQALSVPVGEGSGLPSEYQFFSEDLALAIVHPFLPEEFGKGAEINNLADPPLSPPATEAEEGKQERTIYVRDNKPIAPTGGAETTLYEEAEENGKTMDNPGYVALLTGANLPGVEFGWPKGAPIFLDANPDLTTTVISLGEGAGEKEGLYAWTEGVLKAVSLPPESAELVPGRLGDSGMNKRRAISNDGSRIFWEDDDHHLYMRATMTPSGDSAHEETIQLDKAQGVTEPAEGGAKFQIANAEGSRVFFTDTRPLKEHSGAAYGKPDLYVCEIVEYEVEHEGHKEHKLKCKLTDLTLQHETPAHEVESANVQGLVLGASEDGSYVYFVANGVLSEAPNSEGKPAAPGLCGIEGFPETTCNLYVDHYNSEHAQWETTFIAALSEEDASDWKSVGGSTEEELERVTSRGSPNGLHLAFMSDQELTGYENVDTHPEADGAHDEEVFEYTAASGAKEVAAPGKLICASCNPSGAQPSGVFDPNREEEGKTDLAVDRPGIWEGRWLAGSVPGWTSLASNSGAPPYAIYQSRYLLNNGRLFFDSPAHLVAGAENGKEDVYEYEPTGVPSGGHECTAQSATYSESVEGCIGLISSGTATSEAVFIDASESGSDVFFVSGAKLSPQDKEGTLAVYDAHECIGDELCEPQQATPSSPSCQSTESCRPFSYSPPASGTPTNGNAFGEGNVVPQQKVLPSKIAKETRAQKLAKALKACKKDKQKGKRAACERRARKLYGTHKSEHAKSKQARKSDARGRRPGKATR